jgi:two-component system response regulator AtoC
LSSSAQTVLVVDDDPSIGTVLHALLRQDGIDAEVAHSGAQALSRLEARPFDALITDLRMDGVDGMELLRRVVDRWPDVPVVLITAHGTVPLAVEAMKRGAADFVQKPFDRDEILYVVRKALSAVAHAEERERAGSPRGVLGAISVARSRAMDEAHAIVDRVAPTDSTVLVLGETGTGKELVARALHDGSPRRDAPFIKLHCAALPESLLESELFGYEKGAFTGATNRKPGRIELAERGTLFLDEIGEIAPTTQVKLLRLLQSRDFERLGGTKTLQANVRFVAATHRDLEAMVASGAFREDLFYRLNVVPLWLPPLRDRLDDIEPLARHFCAHHAQAHGRADVSLDDEAIDALRAQPWPGNVRQLQHFVERLVVLSDSASLRLSDVERELVRPSAPATIAAPSSGPSPDRSLDAQRKETEKEALLRALRQAGNNRTRAARILEVSRRTLYNKLSEHGIV